MQQGGVYRSLEAGDMGCVVAAATVGGKALHFPYAGGAGAQGLPRIRQAGSKRSDSLGVGDGDARHSALRNAPLAPVLEKLLIERGGDHLQIEISVQQQLDGVARGADAAGFVAHDALVVDARGLGVVEYALDA